MKWFASLLLLLATCQLCAAQASLSRMDKVSFAGYEYVRVSDWARANGFDSRWTGREKELRVKTRWSTLLFTVDSKKSEINGVGITLSAPVAAKNGSAYISTLDLKTAIQPVLFPPSNRKGQMVRTICLDPGHGGKDPGKQNGHNEEKKFTLLLAREVEKQLKAEGFRVILTRTSDRAVDLYWRPEFAQRNDADLFVSLHYNSGPSGARGAEVYCLTPQGASSSNARGEGATATSFPGNRLNEQNMLLAYYLQRGITKGADLEDRGVKRARFAVLRQAEMPAVLIEGGFMSDSGDASRIYSTAQRRQMAAAIVEGIRNYKKVVER